MRNTTYPQSRYDSERIGVSDERVMAHNPLTEDDILAQLYRVHPKTPPVVSKTRPAHYKVICISLYSEDISKLNKLVADLKRRGHTKANKSQVIRAALDQFNPDLVPNNR